MHLELKPLSQGSLMEARIFRFCALIAFCIFVCSAVSAVSDLRREAEYRDQAAELRETAQKVESICKRTDIPAGDRRTMCEYLPTATEELRQVEAHARDTRSGVMWLAFFAVAFPAGVMALFYAGRWVITGRLRPLAPLGRPVA